MLFRSSYGLSQIPGFKDASPSLQSFATTMLRNAVRGGDFSSAALNWAVSQANSEFTKALRLDNINSKLNQGTTVSYLDQDADNKATVEATAKFADAANISDDKAVDLQKQFVSAFSDSYNQYEDDIKSGKISEEDAIKVAFLPALIPLVGSLGAGVTV